MTDFEKLEQAKRVFATLCKALDNNDWHYKKDEQKLSVECGAQGEDLPMEFNVRVDADRGLVMLLSLIPFKIQEDKRIEAAIAICAINDRLVDGCFDYDVSDGQIFFRMTNSYIESNLGEDVFTYLLFCACQTIDEYNDKLLMLSKGIISVEKFLQLIAKE